MPGVDKSFFLNLDLESSEREEDASVREVFQNEIAILSENDSKNIKKIKEQMKALDNVRSKEECNEDEE